MAEDVKPAEPEAGGGPHVEAATSGPGEKRSVGRPRKDAGKAPLARASESGDPAVHKALADLNAAQMNQATSQAGVDKADADSEGHDDAIKDAKKALADLGYE